MEPHPGGVAWVRGVHVVQRHPHAEAEEALLPQPRHDGEER